MKLAIAVCVVTLVWLWKRGFFDEESAVLSDSTIRRIRAAEGRESFVRDMDESRVIRRTVLDGPTSRYDRVVSR